MSRSRVHIAALLLALSVGACRGDIIREEEDLPLEGTQWRLESVYISGKMTEPDRAEIYSFIFQPDGFLNGQANCNECNGTYHYRDDGDLVLSIGCTEKACGSPRSTIPHFSVYASGVFGHTIERSTLTLRKRQLEGSLTLVFTGAE